MEIVFKKDKETNEVIAFMPYDYQTWQGEFTCYAHLGQHSLTNDEYYRACKLATPDEYKDLKAELESIGYNVEVIKKVNGRKSSIAYQDFLARHRR